MSLALGISTDDFSIGFATTYLTLFITTSIVVLFLLAMTRFIHI